MPLPDPGGKLSASDTLEGEPMDKQLRRCPKCESVNLEPNTTILGPIAWFGFYFVVSLIFATVVAE